MADKISNFKKALRQAKASSNKSNQSKDAFGKELQKYNPPAKKELSPKQGDNKTDRKSNKQVPDKHSKTSGAPRYAINRLPKLANSLGQMQTKIRQYQRSEIQMKAGLYLNIITFNALMHYDLLKERKL